MPVLVFVLGLAIGSFLNVLILRLPQNKSILGFSKCPKCQIRIKWHEKIPLFSFLFLKGPCQNCCSKISFRYFLVELLTAFLFLFVFWAYGGNAAFLVYILFLTGLLVVIAFIDLDHFLILDSLILPGFIFSVSFLLFGAYYPFPADYCRIVSCSVGNSALGLSFFAGFFLFLFFITKKKGIGFGDLNLAGFLGFVFGLRNAVNVFFLTFFIGFIIAIILLVFKKAGLKSKMPLGSIMAVAGILLLLGFDLADFIDFELILRLWTNR